MLGLFYAQRGPYAPKPLRLVLTGGEPELLSPTGVPWKLTILVVNEGETGTFTALIPSVIQGVKIPGASSQSPYRSSPVAWEGGPSDRNQIWGDGTWAYLFVAEYEPARRILRFMAPQSVYSGPHRHQTGAEVQATGPHVRFTLQLRETEAPFRYKLWEVELDLPPSLPPTVNLTPAD